jgi:hypothetical protein
MNAIDYAWETIGEIEHENETIWAKVQSHLVTCFLFGIFVYPFVVRQPKQSFHSRWSSSCWCVSDKWTDWAISSGLNWMNSITWCKLVSQVHLMWTDWAGWTDQIGWAGSSDVNWKNWSSKFIWLNELSWLNGSNWLSPFIWCEPMQLVEQIRPMWTDWIVDDLRGWSPDSSRKECRITTYCANSPSSRRRLRLRSWWSPSAWWKPFHSFIHAPSWFWRGSA